MGRVADHSVEIPSGRIGYGVIEQDGYFHIRFLGPNGVRVKRSLGVDKKALVHKMAAKIIAQEYQTLLAGQVIGWDSAIAKLREEFATSGNRDSTLAAYLKDLALVRRYLDGRGIATTGPADLDEASAKKWLASYVTGRDERIREKGKEKRQHSPHGVEARLGSLSALWSKWFIKKLCIVSSNPWANLQPPKADKKPVRYVTDEGLQHFFGWLTDYYGDWAFPVLFFSLKAYSGCRLADICQLKTTQLRDGRIVFPADEAKGRKERPVPLPEVMFAALKDYAGDNYLWENYPRQLLAILTKKGKPSHQLRQDFAPARLYQWVLNLFKEYGAEFPKRQRITSHQFRKRAFTLAWCGGINAKEASIAFGCGMDTLLKHYVALDEGKVTSSVFERIGANILAPVIGTQSGHNSEKQGSKSLEEHERRRI